MKSKGNCDQIGNGTEQPEAPMKVNVSLRERYGRDAEISFEDRTMGAECSERMRSELRKDVDDALSAFGGLMIAIVEDRLSDVPCQHRILDEVMDLLERYAVSKMQRSEKIRD
jgi:hypothetical protein